MIHFLKIFYNKLVGDPETTSMESRIFHEVSILSVFAISISIGINVFTQIPHISLLMFVGLLLMCILYANSRYRGDLRSSVIIFFVISNALLVANYFINSGIHGPTFILFILSFFITLVLMPTREYFIWIPLNSIIVLALLYVEYHYPTLLKNTYANRISAFTDIGFTYLAVTMCISIVLSYILKSYGMEREKNLKAAEALKQANESKTRLLSILSHDMRSPLNSIQGFLELLLEYELDEDEKRSIKQSLLKETKNTQTMLFNLLSWTKSQMDGGNKVILTKVNVYEALKVSIEIQQTAAMEKMITIVNQIDPKSCVVADLDMFKLVLRNLINNAIKFTNSGGEIELKTERNGDYYVLSVRDNGVGVSEDKLKTLFSLDSGSAYGTNNEKGVGLGLLLCKEFTELQGGKIEVSSKLGEGSTFYLTFPACPEEENEDYPTNEACESTL